MVVRIASVVVLIAAAVPASLYFFSGGESVARVASAVLGAMSLSDLVSGTYERPSETRRKAKPQNAVRQAAKKTTKKVYASRRPGTRDLASGYRTLCVRLCDGYYFPVSAAANENEFARDEQICRSSCSSPAMLFTYKNGEGAPETMSSLDGLPYTDLANAFQYRVSYDAACTCTAEPWSQVAADRHKLYAMNQAAIPGDQTDEMARRALTVSLAERDQATRAKTGADLVVASRTLQAFAAAQRRRIETGAIRRTAAVTREPVVRAEGRKRSVVRAMRNARALTGGRRLSATRQITRVRLADSRMVYRVQR